MSSFQLLPEGWRILEFREADIAIIDGDRGKNYPTKEEFSSQGHCLFLNTGNIKNDIFDFTNCDFITEKKDALLRKGKLLRGDIILTTRGTVGSVAYYNKSVGWDHVRINSGMVILRSGEDLNSDYLYHLLRSPILKSQYQLFSSGAAQPQLPIKDLKRIRLIVPELPTQNKVAAILSAYDDLIENNKRRIALLEKMAEEIYREWFVRFRFPGYQTAEFEKGIPKQWQVKTIKEIVDRKKFGRIYREAEIYDEGKVIVIDQSRSDFLGFYDGEPEHKASVDRPMILFGDHTCKMVLMMRDFSLAENVIPFLPRGDMPVYFLFHLIKDKAKTSEYKRHWTELTTQKVLIPDPNRQKQFSERVVDMYRQIEALKALVANLSKTREMLLPRLISGKLSVENLDIEFPPSMSEDEAA